MTYKTYRKIAWMFVSSMLVACDEQGDTLQTYAHRVALDGALVFADPSTKQVRILDLSEKDLKPETSMHEAPDKVTQVQRRLGNHDQVLLFLRDQGTGGEEPSVSSGLAVVTEKGVQGKIPLEPKFSNLLQSEDGKYAALYGNGPTDHLLDNQAEIALVDLDKTGEEAVAIRALDGLGAAPVAVVFAPEMMLAGVSTRLLVVLSYEAISLIDVEHATRRDTTIDLRSVDGSSDDVPQLAFDADLGRIYAVRPASSEIVVIDLVPEKEAGAGNVFRPVLSTLSLPSLVGDVGVYRLSEQPRLLCALPQQAAVAIVDPVSGDVVLVQVPHPVDSASSYQVGVDENDVRALVLGPSDVSTVSLRDVEAYGSAARVRTLVQRRGTSRLVMVDDIEVALVIHTSGGLSLLDLRAETAIPFATTAFITDLVVDSERGGAWIAARGEDQVAFLDLQSRTQREISLDAEVEGLLPMLKHDRVVALHDSPWGYATVVDADQPKESRAEALLGFLTTGIAD